MAASSAVVLAGAGDRAGADDRLAQEAMATDRMTAMKTVLRPGMLTASQPISADVLYY